ncbi:putative F-box protein [Panicum miliaceum]|uniref:F-box protein n=1 Tax=Panicum miliaceum TaxID=4540 RepID=A0A3L6TMV0_PANMI|nr:putative F-box protein [Panicum miliaceum]
MQYPSLQKCRVQQKRRRRHRAGGGKKDVSTSGQPKRGGPAARLYRQGSGEEPHRKEDIQVNFAGTAHLQKVSDWVLTWVVAVDERSGMHPVSPITSEQIALPLEIAMEQARPIF